MDEATAKAYVEELKRVLIEGSFIHQKAILRKFVKRVELGEKAVTIEYSIPLENEKTSEKEVLDIKQIGRPDCASCPADCLPTGRGSGVQRVVCCHPGADKPVKSGSGLAH